MTEAEILELTAIARSNLIGATQWWASVTFGLIALAHFGRRSLNLPLVTIAVGLYVAFTGWLAIIMIAQIGELGDLRSDLELLASDSYALSQTGLNTVNLPPAMGVALMSLAGIALFGAFSSSIGYLVWTYRSRAKE